MVAEAPFDARTVGEVVHALLDGDFNRRLAALMFADESEQPVALDDVTVLPLGFFIRSHRRRGLLTMDHDHVRQQFIPAEDAGTYADAKRIAPWAVTIIGEGIGWRAFETEQSCDAYVRPAEAVRRGRPPLPEEQRSDKRPRSIRLGDDDWAMLQWLGTSWLEGRIAAARTRLHKRRS